MKAVPPKLIRRVLLAPLVLALELTVLLLSPVLLLLAVLASPFFGGWRPVRLTLIVLAYAAYHVGAVIACLGLWFASGFGRKAASDRFQRAHYVVMRWFVAGVSNSILRLARVEVTVSATEEAERALATHGHPVLLMARHAGEGDTLLVIKELLSRWDRGPRVVMHHALQLDPLIDVLGGRLPNRFVDPRGGDTEYDIAEMAGELGETAALVIFPEGRNFSPERRQQGIERLEGWGYTEQAEQARAMQNLSAPRPGGALAAIEAAPAAEVVVMGHVGFPTGLREVWDLLPEPQTVEVRLWHEPRSGIPTEREAQIDWLFGCWRRLDEWVDERERERATA